MTIHISSFSRDKRRKIAKEAVHRVREQGIRKASAQLLMYCLFGLATQEQMKTLVQLDTSTLEELEPATVHAGRFYEEVRQELIFRVYTGNGLTPPKPVPPEFDTIQWTTEGQKKFRKAILSLWEKDKDNDIFAMLYTQSCLPCESWAWRMYIWYMRGDLMTLPDRLYNYALRKAGKRDLDCIIQGLDFIEYEGSKQNKSRLEATRDDGTEQIDSEELALFSACSYWER